MQSIKPETKHDSEQEIKTELPMKLQNENEHRRDKYLHFNEEKHIYTIWTPSKMTRSSAKQASKSLLNIRNVGENYVSVTTWIKNLFEKFDSDKIINKMMNSKNWSSSKYFGMTKYQIKNQWFVNGRKAAEEGTKMHYNIECFYNDIVKIDNSVEFQYFKQYDDDRTIKYPTLKPYRTEWMVYDEEMKIAGSIDMVYKCEKTGKLHIYDWKRCKEIKKTNPWQNSIHPQLEHIPDTNFWHYTLQLNIYKAVVERNYGMKVEALNLVCLHPENTNYIQYNVPILTDEMTILVDELIKCNKDIK